MAEGLRVETVKLYTPEVAASIGRLMPFLDESFSADPIDEGHLRYIINSPDYDQLIAVHNEVGIVGAATMSIVRGAGFGARGQLEDFVTDEDRDKSRGAGELLWGEGMINWCTEQGLPGFYLQTETWRADEARNAVAFYERMGAELLEGTITFSAKVKG